MLIMLKQIKQNMEKLGDSLYLSKKLNKIVKENNAIIEINNLMDEFNNRLDTKEKTIMN